MLQKWALRGFLVLLASIAFWFFFQAGLAIHSYKRLNYPIGVTIKNWELKEEKNAEYRIVANFFYEYEGISREARMSFPRIYPNRWAAEKALENQGNLSVMKGWVDPKKPSNAVLIRIFPWKKILSATVILFLLGYFSVLIFFVKSRQQG